MTERERGRGGGRVAFFSDIEETHTITVIVFLNIEYCRFRISGFHLIES